MSKEQAHTTEARGGSSGSSRVRLARLNTLNLDKNPNVVVGVSLDGLAEVSYGTRAHWEANPRFVPPKGMIVVWSDHGTVNGKKVPGFKIGDGNAYNIDLPFVGDDVAARIEAALAVHVGTQSIHVSASDRDSWNNKVSIDDNVLNETLVFRR